MRSLGLPEAHGRLAVAPDGEQVACLARGRDDRPDEVLPTCDRPAGERPVHLRRSPDGRRPPPVGRQWPSGGGRPACPRWLDAAGGRPRSLDGAGAFLARAVELTVLCPTRTADGTFRYVADLGGDGQRVSPSPPVAWSPDGRRRLHAAPDRDRTASGGGLAGAQPPVRLFSGEVAKPLGKPGGAEDRAPARLGGGVVVAVGQGSASAPRAGESGHEPRNLADVPVRTHSGLAARRGATHARRPVATGRSAAPGTHRPAYRPLRSGQEVGR